MYTSAHVVTVDIWISEHIEQDKHCSSLCFSCALDLR